MQIAQVPGRNEPNSAGELNYSYLLDTLESCGYHGYVGCEYKPLGERLFLRVSLIVEPIPNQIC